MEDMKERLVKSVSTGELERRWKAAREVMKERKIDFLLMRQDEEYYGGYVRWFSAIAPRHSYPVTVIFPIDDEMTTISSSPYAPPNEGRPPAWAVRGVKTRLGAPYYVSLHYSSTWDAELAVGFFKERKPTTIGFVGLSSIHVPFHQYLTQHLPGVRFVDATDPIDHLKAVKSPEEIELIKGTARLQDSVMAHLKTVIRPGMKDLEINGEADYVSNKLGATRLQVLISSYQPGEQTVGFMGRHFMNRVLRKGDQVVVLLEGNGPGGFYTELARVFSLGEPSPEAREMYALAVEAQEYARKMLKPGADPREIWDAINAFLQKGGGGPEGRLNSHGEGYEMVERPVIRPEEPMKLKAGMNLAVHPVGKTKRVWICLCNNYLVTETGIAESLHNTPKDIIVV